MRREAITSLKENYSIVIKRVDKSEAVAVMNKTHYYSMVVKILQDEETYEKNQWKLWQKSFQRPWKTCCQFSNFLLKEEQDFLTKFSFSASNFYDLPRAHKFKTIQEGIQVQSSEYIKIHELSDSTLRATDAGSNSPTRRLSNLVDTLSKSFLIHIKSYIKGNLDFLAKFSRENKWDTILTTFDVVGLIQI